MAFKSDRHRKWYYANKKKGTLPQKKKEKPWVSGGSFSRLPSPLRVNFPEYDGIGPVQRNGAF